jgi:UPF0755 protein
MRFFLTMLAVIALSVIVALVYTWDYFEGPGPSGQPVTVLFKRGVGFHGIVDGLAQQGVITDPLLFKALAATVGNGRAFKAGEYVFPAQATPHTVMQMLAEGRVVVHKITIPEGLNVREVVKLLQGEPALEGDVALPIAEGSLLPETYNYTYGDKRQGIVVRMQAGMRALLADAWARRKAGLPFDTVEQGLVLASIVEKETGVADERGRVASVFINRLRKGMKLQSDPTVAYGLGQPASHGLTGADLQSDTPYNTYVIAALPPGPICNPGRTAIEATFNPPDTEDVYFVATGSGGHNFAGSLEAHNDNVRKYREKRSGK